MKGEKKKRKGLNLLPVSPKGKFSSSAQKRKHPLPQNTSTPTTKTKEGRLKGFSGFMAGGEASTGQSLSGRRSKTRNSEMGTKQYPTGTQRNGVGPSTALAYLDPKYWDERFSSEEHYEWLKDYSHFRHLIQSHITPNSSVLELGCGNSQLSEELYKDGVTEITCIDLSAVAVENMRKKLQSKGFKEIKVLEADMLDLPFSNECFDVVIEKGTMEVLFVDSGDPWNPRPATVTKVMKMLEGVHRVLKPDGIYISISFGQPHFRRPFFDAPQFTWSVEWSTFGDGFHYFFYTLKKGRRSLDDKGSSKEKLETPSICLFQDELEGEDYLFRTNIDELNS